MVEKRVRRVLGAFFTAVILTCTAIAQPGADGTTRWEFNQRTTAGPEAMWKLERYVLIVEKGAQSHVALRAAAEGERPSDSGAVAAVFNGQAGFYTLTFEFLDSAGGRTSMQLKVDGKPIDRWYGDNLFSVVTARHAVPHVELKPGSRIEWLGRASGKDRAALLALEIAPGQPAPPTPVVMIAPANYSGNLVPVADHIGTVDPRLMIPPPSRSWPDVGTPADAAMPAFIFGAAKGDRFEAAIGNPTKADRTHAWRIHPWPDDGKPLASGTINVPGGAAAPIGFTVPDAGVYALRSGGAVTGLSHRLNRPLTNVPNVHFLVPKGAPGLRIVGPARGKNPIEFLVRDAAGVVVFQGEVAARQKVDFAVPPEKSGQVWSFESDSASLSIEGVPPYAALAAADLLAPAETLPAARIAGAKLPADPVKPIAATAVMPGAPAVTLVKAGQPTGVIVARSADEAARDLQRTLQKVTGALVPIVTDLPQQGAAIIVAVENEFPDLPVPAGFNALNHQGLFIRTHGDRLYIVGRHLPAVQPAVYTFLRQIGCRWYFGNDHWELLPSSRDLTVAMDLVTQPDFLLRRITVGPNALGTREMDVWGTRNRLASGISGSINHSYESFVDKHLFEKHPEYFSMKDTNNDGVGDTRTQTQPCTTHPEVIKLFVDKAVQRFADDPKLDLLPVSPNDGTPSMCRCERCVAVGSYSDCAWTLAHQCATAVRAKFPGRQFWIGFYAYGVVSRPPTLKADVDPNIAVQIATSYNKVSVARMFEEWPKYVGLIGIREYFAIPQWGANNPGRGITPAKARRVIPLYKANKAVMLNAEGCPAWGASGLGMYVAAQLMWDSSADPDQILAEFYTDCFGAAAPAMQRYFERWNRELIEPRTAKLALVDLREALQKADTIGAKRRVAMFGLYLHSLQLNSTWQDMDEDVDTRTDFAEAGGAFRWRSRHLGLLRMTSAMDSDAYPGHPYFTHEEVVSLIDQDLAALKDVDTAELVTQFSTDLTPVAAQAGCKLNPCDPWVTTENRTWVFNLDKGKPVTLRIAGQGGKLQARLFGPRPSAPAETKDVTLDRDETTLQFTAAETGPHRLLVTAEKVKYQLVDPVYVVSLMSKEKNRSWFVAYTEKGPSQVSFYVPIGAEGIYFGHSGKTSPGGVVELVDNQGRVVHQFDTRHKDGRIGGEPVLVHVPPGADNQVWTARTSSHVAAGRVLLRGVPPYVQADPTRLLVPKAGSQDADE